jgi:hypothetical protein
MMEHATIVNRDRVHYYHSFEWANSHGVTTESLGFGMLYYFLTEFSGGHRCVCIGSGGGFVPSIMRQSQKENNIKGARTYLIDAVTDAGYGTPAWAGNSDHKFMRHYKDVHKILKKSADAVKDINFHINYLHIDGDHSYDGVKRDFEDYSPLMTEDGVITVHDTDIPGIRDYLQEITGTIPFERMSFGKVAVFKRMEEFKNA